MRTPRTAGFTLIEMMVVIFIVGMLAAILLPALLDANKTAKQTQCLSNLRQLGIAFKVYLDQNHYIYPPAVTTDVKVGMGSYGRKEWMDLIRPLMDRGSLTDGIEILDEYKGENWKLYKQFECPSNRQTTSGGGRFDYGYNLNCEGLNGNTVTPDMVVLHCANHYAPPGVTGRNSNPGIHQGFDNYLFHDGHVESSNSFWKKAADKPPWLAVY